MTTYAQYLSDLVPTWLRANYGASWMESHGEQLDLVLDLCKNAVKARFLDTAPEDAVALLGIDRALERYPNENPRAYLSRLRGVWDFWGLAGTKSGMLLAITYAGYSGRTATFRESGEFYTVNAAGIATSPHSVPLTVLDEYKVVEGTTTLEFGGQTWEVETYTLSDEARYYSHFPSQIIEHYQTDPSIWSEFSLILFPDRTEFTGWQYGTGTWGDGRVWGLDIPAGEADRIRSIVEKVKPAHTKLNEIKYVKGGAVWGTFSYADGTEYGGEVITL